LEERISAARAARLIGIKTQTLAKWRCQGRGPGGWVRVSATHVTYAEADVERFLAERALLSKREP
jgi:transposase-like protein